MTLPKLLPVALAWGVSTLAALAQDGQPIVLQDEPDAYWTMGKLTDTEDGIFAEFGEASSGDPLHMELPLNLDPNDDAGFPTLVGGIVPTAGDGAMLFDAAEGQALAIADSPHTNDVPGNPGVTNRTYELWFQPRNLPETGEENRQIIYMEGGTTRGMTIYLDGTEDGDPTEADLYIMTANLAEEVWGGSIGPLDTDPDFALKAKVQKGETYHLAFVMDKPDDFQEDLNGNLIGYLNGEEFGRLEGSGLWFNHVDDSGFGARFDQTVFHDGVITGGERYFFDGIIDEVAIYAEESLTAEQIQAHYLAGIGTGETLLTEFTASAALVAAGGDVTLSWAVNDFEDLTINNEVGDVAGSTADGTGTITVNPTETTTYTITAEKGDLTQSLSVSVFVGPPLVNSFTTNDSDTIKVGASTTIEWRIAGETSVTIEPGIGDVGDALSVVVSPTETTTYTLTATNEIGSVTSEFTVNVVSADTPDIYWPMGTLTEDEDAVLAVFGEDSNGDPIHGVLEAEGDLPVVVPGIVAGTTDGAMLFDAEEAQSLSINNSPFTNNVPGNPGVANRTYELWFQPRNLPVSGEEERQIIFEEGGTTRGLAIYLDGTQGSNPTEANVYVMTTNLAEEVWGGTTGPLDTDPDFAVSATVRKDEIYHLVFVMDKPDDVREDLNGNLIGYLNGQEFGRVEETGLWFNHTDRAGIGKPYADTVFHDGIVSGAGGSGLYSYDGIIDEFSIFEGVSLSASTVLERYKAGSGGGSFQITDIVLGADGNSASVTWGSTAGRSYGIDSSVDLVTWGELADGVEADEGEETTFVDTFSEGNPRPNELYYRIREE